MSKFPRAARKLINVTILKKPTKYVQKNCRPMLSMLASIAIASAPPKRLPQEQEEEEISTAPLIHFTYCYLSFYLDIF